MGRLECTVRVRGSQTRSYMGSVFGPWAEVEEVVVCGFAAARRRAATREGAVLRSRLWCKGEKKACRER